MIFYSPLPRPLPVATGGVEKSNKPLGGVFTEHDAKQLPRGRDMDIRHYGSRLNAQRSTRLARRGAATQKMIII